MSKQTETRATSAIIGACGEHYVSAYLSGFQLIVALPRAGVPGCDLLVTGKKSGHAIRLQVKTGTQPRANSKTWGEMYRWATSLSVIERKDPHLWYAYVALNGWPQKDGTPEVFFVPASVVIEVMAEETDASWSYFWLNVEKAQKYKGNEGLKAILDVLKVNSSKQ